MSSTPRLALLADRELAYLDRGFRTLLPLGHDLEGHLLGVLGDALAHPGSLGRAQLAFAVLCELGMPKDKARELAVAIEYFHTASLLFDDLPAMDDARERRGRPCPHVVHGEAATMLGALGLITQAYHLLWGILSDLPAERRARASELVAASLGVAGTLDGQARDLHFATARTGRGRLERTRQVERVAEGKTVPLIRLALVLPALVGGADEAELAALERLSSAWGLAYQGLDDCKDGLLDAREAGKSTARDGLLGRPNLPAAAGWTGAVRRVTRRLGQSRTALAELVRQRNGWSRLLPLQAHLESELAALRSRARALAA